MTAHPKRPHHTPSASTTVERLREIPDLAAQAYTSRDTPHRGGRGAGRASAAPGPRVSSSAPIPTHLRKRGGGKLAGSPIPAEVACWDLLRDDEHGLIQELIEACEAIRGDMEQPPDLPASTWAAVCSDLLGLSDWWQSDDLLHDWVSSSVTHVHSSLSRWVGDPRQVRLTCTRCGGRLAVERAGDSPNAAAAVVCGDCGHVWHAATVAHEATMRTPLPVTEIAERLGVPLRTVQRYASLIQPETDHEPSPKRPALYLPGKFEPLRRVH